MPKKIIFCCLFVVCLLSNFEVSAKRIKVAAEQTKLYFPLLRGKNVGVVANQTSVVGKTHLVDTLLGSGINVKKIFCPEHGFRGQAEAGAEINNDIDQKTGLPIVSLYGKTKKPTISHLSGLDVLIFDIQDVGVRFFTYISTLHYVMEACAENSVSIIVLDRPNPNGFYVDGPVLDTNFRSFVGMHPVPVVHGMTIGEYATMLKGERWFKCADSCMLTVIKIANYTHDSLYRLPIAPSPNLQKMNAIYLYPSLCCFEGTIISVGRGTEYPFEVIGAPNYQKHRYSFTPQPIKGVSENPLHKGQLCYGLNLKRAGYKVIKKKKLNLHYLINMYNNTCDSNFFLKNNFFDRLMGNDTLRKQIEEGQTEKDIRKSWEPELSNFKHLRKKYLLYK